MKALRKEGLGFFWRAGASPFQRAGVSDILGVVNGYFVAIEVKTPEAWAKASLGRTDSQILFAEQVKKEGGFATTVCSVSEAQKFVGRVFAKTLLDKPAPDR